MKLYIQKLGKLGLLLSLVWAMFSCEDTMDSSEFILDAPLNINSFTISNIEGEIDHEAGRITFSLPYNSDVTALIPVAELPQGATINPALEVPTNFSSNVEYTVINGNRFKKYKVIVNVLPPILSFSINGISAHISNSNKAITLTLPAGTDVSALQPEIELSTGVSISPSSGSTVDFTEPVDFTVSIGNHSAVYTATVIIEGGALKIAYLGKAEIRSAITDPDEKEAADWLFNNFANVSYLSFQEVSTGRDLSEFGLIWWHFDEAMDLPEIALNAQVVNSLKAYRASGGTFLLTTFAARYVEALGVVPQGKGPNNVFGDFPPHGFVDQNNNWGMSFRGHENHPVFQGLDTYDHGKAYLLEKGTFRLNHTAWWFLPEWGGYGNGEGWRNQTGGNNLASEGWDDHLNGRVTIAEFPGNAAEGKVMIISMGAYDWYQEEHNGTPSQPNGFRHNIERLTENAIKYLMGE